MLPEFHRKLPRQKRSLRRLEDSLSSKASASAYGRSENVGIHAVIVSELELRDVERKVLFADFVEDANHPALNQRPEPFNGVGMDRADNVLALGVIDGRVGIFFSEMLIANPLIGDQQTDFVRDGFMYKAFQCIRAEVLDYAGNDVALAADRASNDGFPGPGATSPVTMAPVMPILGFSADESFVHLYNAPKLVHIPFDQRGSDLVTHQPSGLVGTEAEEAIDLQRAHSLLAGEHQVDDAKPVFEGLIRVLEDRPGDVREAIGRFLGALVALPMPRVTLQLSRLYSATARAMDAFRPTLTDQIGATGFLIRERLIELCGGQLVDVFPGSHGRVPHYGRNMPCQIQ